MPQQRYRTRGTPLDDKPAHASRKNLLFAAAVEALGLIGTPEAGEALLAEVVRLPAFPIYDRRAAWIGNQTSPVHFRFLQAFDATRLSTNISSPHVHRMVLAGIVS